MPLPNPVRQKAARDKLAQVFAHPASVYAIHYACQSFHDGDEASLSPICIAVRQMESGQVTSFSMAKIAELARIAPHDIPRHWAYLERSMLGEFYEFVRTHHGARYVHWNMRDDRFGFAALAHRMQVLQGRPEDIPEERRIDLVQILDDLFGDGLVRQRAKLEALGKLNGLAMGSFLPGAAEAEAVAAGRYRDVHGSTLAKVRLIADVAARAHDRTLKTEAGLLAQYAGPFRLIAQRLFDNPGYSIATALVGGFVVMFKAYDWMFG
jgi:hypothetical protein